MARGTTHSRGMAAMSVETCAVTASISADGRNASASQRPTLARPSPWTVMSSCSGTAGPGDLMATRPHVAVRSAKTANPTDQVMRCWASVRWGSMRKG